MIDIVGLDFETYASTDLPKHGLHRYVNCSDFRVLLAAVQEQQPDGSTLMHLLDFVKYDYDGEIDRLEKLLSGKHIAAHNAGFEQAVLGRLGLGMTSDRFIDSAVLARAAGAGSKLEAAAPQLLGMDKLETGHELIKLFCMPGKYQADLGLTSFDPKIIEDHPAEWDEFARYCLVDAQLSLQLAQKFPISNQESENNSVTMDMNSVGWHVDLEMVREMQSRYLHNIDATVAEFREWTGAKDLNLNSFPQLQAWCRDRGVRTSSFDEKAVARMERSVTRKMESGTTTPAQEHDYREVLHLLQTKRVMGGSSLKKLQTILDTVGTDGRLHDQYLHIGAGATFRTTGRGVQMQNLKRLNGEGDDMAELLNPFVSWDNVKLATNLRQVFTSSHRGGALVVGDFSSVESRGLAWQAGEDWKITAYLRREDLYKVQAGRIFGKPVIHIIKSERQIGKVGELACGYGAGAEAVREFASKMGVELTDVEAANLVKDWRSANPMSVRYWQHLDDALHAALQSGQLQHVDMPHGYIRIIPHAAPDSLRKQVGDQQLRSLDISMYLTSGTHLFTRVIHGTREVGRNIQYFKPSERKTGDLWVDEFTNPKTRRRQKYTLYGGKLAGLLTQSLCRELFFDSLRDVHSWADGLPNVQVVGQFHDEIVLDWQPSAWSGITLPYVEGALTRIMSTGKLPGFPLAAEIKSDYRYIK